MAIDWNAIINHNIKIIIKSAQQVTQTNSPICALYELDQAQPGKPWADLIQLIVNTATGDSVPLKDPEGVRCIVCLVVGLAPMLAALDPLEMNTAMKPQIVFEDGVILLAICFESEEYTCQEIRKVNPRQS